MISDYLIILNRLYIFFSKHLTIVMFNFSFVLQNAGAVIGKGGKNIKALRSDVSTSKFSYHSQKFKKNIFVFTGLSDSTFSVWTGPGFASILFKC